MAAPPGLTLALAGDVMTGRGLDQILPHPGDPALDEGFVKDARDYVGFAEQRGGPIPRPVDPAYPWGEALEALDRAAPAARIVNLETAVAAGGAPWPGKEVHYRMHPANLACLQAAKLDVCGLANNHAMDYGTEGLEETLAALARAGLRSAGAGRDQAAAEAPARVPLPGGRSLLVFALAGPDCGVPKAWAARKDRPGLAWMPAFGAVEADALLARIAAAKGRGDLAVVSLHWGTNWGYEVPPVHRRFAHRLLEGGADLVLGHSSHHPRPVELHAGRLILYGCGDFLDDYEGIGGHEAFPDVRVLYLPTLDPETGALRGLRLLPFRSWRMRLTHVPSAEAEALARLLTRLSGPQGPAFRAEGTELRLV